MNKFGGKKTVHLLKLIPERCTIYRRKKKEHDIKVWPQLALSMSSTNVGKNCYCLISLILTLEQNILVTITSWQPLVFILSSQFPVDSSCCLVHFFTSLLHVGLIEPCFTFSVSKGGIHARMSFLLLLLLFPTTQDLFLAKFLARIRSWIPYLKFVCGYKRVLGSLQVGRATRHRLLLKPLRTSQALKGHKINNNLSTTTPYLLRFHSRIWRKLSSRLCEQSIIDIWTVAIRNSPFYSSRRHIGYASAQTW